MRTLICNRCGVKCYHNAMLKHTIERHAMSYVLLPDGSAIPLADTIIVKVRDGSGEQFIKMLRDDGVDAAILEHSIDMVPGPDVDDYIPWGEG